MKKIVFVILLSGFYAFGSPDTDIDQTNEFLASDKAGIEAQMRALDDLENTVLARPGVSYQVLKTENNANLILANVSDNSNTSMILSSRPSGPPIGVPSFIWGFCGGILGMIFVHLYTKDSQQTKLAMIGCIIGNLVTFAVIFISLATIPF